MRPAQKKKQKDSQLLRNNYISDIIMRKENVESADLVVRKNDVELLENISELALLKNQIKELEIKEKLLETSLKLTIGDRERVVYNGVVLATLKEFSRENFDSKRLQQEFPDVHSKFINFSTYKVLKVKETVQLSY